MSQRHIREPSGSLYDAFFFLVENYGQSVFHSSLIQSKEFSMSDRTVLIDYPRPKMASLSVQCRVPKCPMIELYFWEFGQAWPTGHYVLHPDTEEGYIVFESDAILQRLQDNGQYLHFQSVVRLGPRRYELVFLDYQVPVGYWELKRHSQPAPVLQDFASQEVSLVFSVVDGDIASLESRYQKSFTDNPTSL